MTFERNGRFFISPGSATGVDLSVPSFVLMDLNASKCVFYIYRILDEQVKVDKLDWEVIRH